MYNNLDNHRLGVVVPVYNAEKYLRKCVESILAQTYSDIQIVLVDDGSDDNSGSICDDYANTDNRVSVIHQINKGRVVARYEGVKILTTDYITFVDSDDWIKSDTYESLKRYMDDNIDMIEYAKCMYYSEDRKVCSETIHKPGLYVKHNIDEILLDGLIWVPENHCFGVDPSLCNKLIKREILIEEFEKIKNMNLTIGEDCAVVYPLFKSIDSFFFSEKGMYYHRQRMDGDIAPYVKDVSYNWKLAVLYRHLMDEFSSYPECIRQLDWFFAEYAKLRLGIYQERMEEEKYLFPYSQVDKDSKVIIYGAGNVGKSYYKQVKDTQYCDIVAWLDQKKISYLDGTTVNPSRVVEYHDYNYVVVAIADEEVSSIISHTLKDYGVREEMIVWNIIRM